MARNILITGCSGGGKSTLIGELNRLGFAVIHEPGLRVIQSGGPKPWEDLPNFVKHVTDLAQADLDAAQKHEGPLFFDRGLFDALSGKAHRENTAISAIMPEPFPYIEPVFFAPPWEEIFENTPDRQLSFDAGKDEAIRLRKDLETLAITTVELPKCALDLRVKFALETLGLN